jgi:hypothetical protein
LKGCERDQAIGIDTLVRSLFDASLARPVFAIQRTWSKISGRAALRNSRPDRSHMISAGAAEDGNGNRLPAND